MNSSLQKVTKTSIEKISTVKEAIHVKNMADAAEIFYKAQDDIFAAQYAKEISFRSARQAGRILLPPKSGGKIPRKRGGDRKSNVLIKTFDLTLTPYQEVIESTGITSYMANTWKLLSLIPENKFEAYINDPRFANTEFTISGLLKFSLQIIGDSTGNEWWTPITYIESVRKVLGEIDLDPASCDEANKVVRAKKIYTELDSGLAHNWHGQVFMNPPYSANKEFAEKMYQEYTSGNVTEAIILLGAHAIETKWFAQYWDHVLCFTGHRIKFNTPTGAAIAGNIAGSVFVHLGQDSHLFAKEFAQHGYVVKRWP